MPFVYPAETFNNVLPARQIFNVTQQHDLDDHILHSVVYTNTVVLLFHVDILNQRRPMMTACQNNKHV